MQVVLKKKKIVIIAAAALLAVLAVIFAVTANSSRYDPAKQLSIGQKFLEELDYNNAILTFGKIIEVEPMNVQAYLGLADAYIGKGDTAAAIDALKRGYDATGDATVKARLDELTKPVDQDNGAEMPPESTEPVFEEIAPYTPEQQDMLALLFTKVQSGDYDGFLEYLRSGQLLEAFLNFPRDNNYNINLIYGESGGPLLTIRIMNSDANINCAYFKSGDLLNGEVVVLMSSASPDSEIFIFDNMLVKGTLQNQMYSGTVEEMTYFYDPTEKVTQTQARQGITANNHWVGDVRYVEENKLNGYVDTRTQIYTDAGELISTDMSASQFPGWGTNGINEWNYYLPNCSYTFLDSGAPYLPNENYRGWETLSNEKAEN